VPLAIIGIGCLFPGAENLHAFWSNIANGVDGISDIPSTHWRPEDYRDADPKAPDRVYTARGGFLRPVPFHPSDFGIAPNNVEAIDTAQLLGLMVAQEALADAGYTAENSAFDRSRVGVILGVTGTLELVIPLGARLGHPIWRRALQEAGVEERVAEDVVRRIADSYVGWQENSFPGLLGNVVAGRIANRFDLGGTNCVVDAACASSLSALHLASLELTTSRADVVLTGGVDTFNDIFMYMCFSKTPALSPTGDARPFDAAGDGTILGEGLGMVVLKRLADARRDGDRIYAVIRGIGSSSDGKGNAVYAPKGEGQAAALRRAYDAAGVTPDTIELVEAHGTGTRVGDATEVAALTEVYQGSGREGTWCALGSVKSQIGHTKAAAGAAGLIKAVAALYHKVLPPTIKVEQPLDALQPGRTPFYVNTEKRPWMPSDAHPRRAAVSAFGFGGSNFHCVVEEADPRKTAIDWDGTVQIVAFGADSPEQLRQQLGEWPADLPWDELSRRAAASRAEWRSDCLCRLLVAVQRDGSGLKRLLEGAAAMVTNHPEKRSWHIPDGVFFGRGEPVGKLAVLFPGQGAQCTGMLRDLACHFPAAHDVLADADRVFREGHEGARLSDLIYPVPAFSTEGRSANEEALRATQAAQPALGAVSLGVWRVLEEFGVRADAFAGHSYGELTALCAAGRLDAMDFHRASVVRGRLMAEAGRGEGAMLAVLAPSQTIEAVLREENLDLVLANKNAPAQTVLSGRTSEIELAATAFAGRQIRAQRLAVSAAFHSPLIADAREPFRDALEKLRFHSDRVVVFANSTAEPYPDDPILACDLLAGQLTSPVEFVQEIENLYQFGVRTFLEVGPGARLTGMVGAILERRDHEALAVDGSSGQRSGFFDLACALARLAALGHGPRLSAWDPVAAGRDPLDAKKLALVIPLCGANYVKPKPKRPPTVHRPALHGSSHSTMNGTSPPRDPSPAPATPSDNAALSQALQITRESMAALLKVQEQTAQLHRQFLEGQENAQRTVHLLVEQQQRMLQTSLGLSPTVPVPIAPVTQWPVVPPEPTPPAPVPAASLPTFAPPAPVPSNARIESILLEVVSEKTGYPVEMLGLDMALDADLGIDSIKRVEILSALQDRLPEAPAVKSEHLGTLHTLRHVADFLANGNALASGGRQPPDGENDQGTDVPRSPDLDSVQTVLLEVVSEKTGYPVEMLGLDMALDADLGIDSIKRVEILSALQDRLPEAPAVKPEHLGTLHTLRHVADFLANGSSSARKAVDPPAPVPVSAPLARIERSVLRVVLLESQAAREPIRLAAGSEFWVVTDEDGLARCLARRLRQLGVHPRLLSCAAIREQMPPATLSGLLIVAPIQGADDSFLKDALFALRHVASGLRQAGAVFVTVARMDGAFGLREMDPRRDPLDGGLAGLTKTAAHEWPEVRCKAIDLAADFADPDAAAAALVEEVLLCGPVEVGVSRNDRVMLERIVQPLPTVTGSVPFQPGEVVVVSGGARGVTAEVAVALARAFRPTLVLLGRSPAPEREPDWLVPLAGEVEIKRELGLRANGNASPRLIGEQYGRVAAQREIRETLARIETASARTIYHSVDVRDAAAVAAILEPLRAEVGPVRGLIHGAGVLADALIEDKTPEQFDRVFSTKVDGLRALLRCVRPEELRVLALFSSSTGRLGRKGQVDYAMANEVLNKMARQQARQLPSCRVVSVNWGPWDGGMVTPSLRKLFEQEGIGLIAPEIGAEYFVSEISQTAERSVEVVALAAGTVAPPILAQSLPLAFEKTLDLASHPILRDHVLDGRPVLPLALTLEWLAHGALHQNPGLVFHGCNDLRVLHGVILGETQVTVRVVAGKAVRSDGLFLVPVEFRSTHDGREVLHARAEVVLTTDLPPAPDAREAPAGRPYPRGLEEIYQDLLFHGPEFQGIEKVEGCDERGISACIRCAPPPAVWIRNPLRQKWLADPLVLDASFQMMILWSAEQHAAPSLPCRAARYRQFRRSFPVDGVRVVIRVTRSNDLHALADIDYLDGNGRVVARMEDYECAMDPGLRKAFRRRELVQL
jgi:acyl transferase domain-containing protein/NAD(P)-dependent dehydrogenase (short-subunit alcohol dehydrogenase family)